jgi:nicotinamide-nucleotide amidase
MLSTDAMGMAAKLLDACADRGIMLATAESCTGGLIAGCLTAIAGSSRVVDRGFVTYSYAAKNEILGVDANLVARTGAVDADVATAMAEGAVARSNADLTVAVTGIAGPGGGSPDKPVGLVYLATARRDGGSETWRMTYGDLGRDGIRAATVMTALEMLAKRVENW